MSMLNDIANYGLSTNYIEEREEIVQSMSLEAHRMLAEKYVIPDRMIYLVVGDAETQLEALGELGLGESIMLDKRGNLIGEEAKAPARQ